MSGDPFGVSVFLGISFRLAGLAALELPLQEGLDKGEQASIENSLYIPCFMAGSPVLGEGEGLEDIAPDLAAEGDLAFFSVHFLQLLLTLALLEEDDA